MGGARSTLQRPSAGNPYQSTTSPFSQFPFASRTAAPQAPLFYSATDDFREEDDEEEHEREVADFYALQRSRRQFVDQPLDESSEGEDEGGSRGSELGRSAGNSREAEERGRRMGGIRSSWKGGRNSGKKDRLRQSQLPGHVESPRREASSSERASSESSRGKGKMVDVTLENTLRSEAELLDHDVPPGDLIADTLHENPPSVQYVPKKTTAPPGYSQFLPQETTEDAYRERPQPPDSDSSSVPPTLSKSPTEPPRHDPFWGNLYIISLAALFSTFLLVYLHTSAPSSKKPLGDTIYSTLHASFHLLATDTLIAIIVSLLWLALLRSYIRPLIYTILVAVPIILLSFSIVPLIASFRGTYHGSSVQDKLMRWFSILPAIAAVAWIYGVYTSRHAFGKAVHILEFACRILGTHPALLLQGFGHLIFVVAWTWLWMLMFTRVFLGGHLAPTVPGSLLGGMKSFFIIDVSTWWLGVFFILQYLWTLGINSGIQRSTTAATVSQWYFHRLAVPSPTSAQVVQAAVTHAATTLFGTVALSSLFTLLIRLPLLALPRRITALLGLCTYAILPQSVTVLTHPLTLTYAAIHSQPLSIAAHALSQMPFIVPSSATGGRHAGILQGRRFQANVNRNAKATSSIAPYNLALLLLHSMRLIASAAFGVGAWVNVARALRLAAPSASSATTIKGSLYAYIVGLIAGTIGWAVLGAMEGVLAGVVDALVVCWGSEVRDGGEARYCREVAGLFDGVGNGGATVGGGMGSDQEDEEESLIGRR
ncbi:hypothetical protein MMC25_000929 [Agyrium rufum]|nr:hypothetical protein [Agyrium rufum]